MAKKKDPRGYRKQGLDFTNVDFSGKAERAFVKSSIARIAEVISEARRSQGLSQEKLAEIANVSVSTIKFIEQNQRAPSLPLLMKLIYVLDLRALLWSCLR